MSQKVLAELKHRAKKTPLSKSQIRTINQELLYVFSKTIYEQLTHPPTRQNCLLVLASAQYCWDKSTLRAAVVKDFPPHRAAVVTSGPQTKKGLKSTILEMKPAAWRPSGHNTLKDAPAQQGKLMTAVTPYLRRNCKFSDANIRLLLGEMSQGSRQQRSWRKAEMRVSRCQPGKMKFENKDHFQCQFFPPLVEEIHP